MGEITGAKIFFAMLNFAVLYLILRRILFKPVNKIITSREDEVKNMYNDAEKRVLQADKREKESEEARLNIKREGNKLIEGYKIKAEAVYDEILEEAKIEATKVRQRAKLDAKREMERTKADIKDQVVDLAMLLTKKVLDQNIEPSVYTDIIDEFIAEVGNE
ncbi:MAG: F0F1 ATP synthase subunit B [Clostridium sp.]